MDLYTKEIVGINISRFQNKFLVVGALKDAVIHYRTPEIVHSDQGPEYDSEDFIALNHFLGILRLKREI